MKRKTTITLTIAGLLGLAGLLYGGPYVFFSPDIQPTTPPSGPVGVAASQTELFASDFCILTNPDHRNIDTISCQGVPSLLTSIPSFVGSTCEEMYLAIAPIQSANAGFTPRDVFVTNGVLIYRFTPPNPPNPLTAADIFAVIPDAGCGPDHTGITFDHEGTFGNDMIVTCKGSNDVWKVDGAGASTFIANVAGATQIEGPAVVPATFGPQGGQIWVADEDFSGSVPVGAVHAISSTGVVTLNVVSHGGAESVQVIPTAPCTFCSGGAHFQAITLDNFAPGPGIYQVFPADFATLGGDVLVTSESGFGTVSVHFDGTNYVKSFFDAIPGGGFEGSTFVDCSVPTPTPTPTPSATFTPTPTPTPSATFTPTPTPTPTPAGVCPLTQGFWKNHPNAWPVTSLTLGTVVYNQSQLLTILNTPVKGDASLILAYQLIAAKLNIANGSDPTPIAATIVTADGLLDGCVLPCHVSPSSTLGMQMTAAAAILDQYNNGQLTPGCSGGGSQSAGATSAHKASPKGKSKLNRLLHPFRK